MTKEKLLELWQKMFDSKKVSKQFTSMVAGRHDKVGDGWRKLTLRIENVFVEITIERSPVGFFIYSGDYYFKLSRDAEEKKIYEQMCIDFDKRGTLYEGTEITIDRINELL